MYIVYDRYCFILKSVNVTVAPESAEDDLQSAKESILTIAPVWDDSNSIIQKFSPAQAPIPADEKDLLDSYPIPQPDSFELTKVDCYYYSELIYPP